jgi:hypothetical protein
VERIRKLNWYQKLLIIVLIAMIGFFTVLYQQTISRSGFRYRDEILVLLPKEITGVSYQQIYSGQINGQSAVFTVSSDRTVLFVCGNRAYGPYRFHADDSARPDREGMREMATGMEIYLDDQLLFRGGAMKTSEGQYWLFNEDGSVADSGVLPGSNGKYGDWRDGDGIMHAMEEPSLADVAALMLGPKIEHDGSWGMWFLGCLLAAATIVFILYAETIFRWSLAFLIRRPEEAEPSDWELTSRYLYWTAMAAITALVFTVGLKMG